MISDIFPIEIVEKLLNENIIANSNINDMKYLMVIWEEYIEPDLDINCGLCKGRILDNFKQIQPQLINRLYNHNLLNVN